MDTSAGTADLPGYFVAGHPDLHVPLYPAGSWPASFVRSTLVRLRTPRFAEAQRVNRRGFLVLLALWAGKFAMVPAVRPYLDWSCVALMLWLLARVYALGWAEKQQRSYEERWLAAQTANLRDTWFEVVRCTVRRSQGAGLDEPAEAGYVLGRSDEVRKLLERQASERVAGGSSQVALEFTFPLPGMQFAALETAHANLTDIEVIVTGRTARCGAVRFPQAACHAEPAGRGRHGGPGPGRTTFWVLGAPVLTMAAPGGAPTVRADVPASADSRTAR
ncbi:hypothetical protein [Streptomyces cavernicola]|uniref:SMODS-associated and fused to various effectors domain-containing protein n=1 Tax=Streptomyces cavernicola TaxID=3043613 RepID=A0ABT6S917_9ACTN|nr:hypothetical protein [Streptomyces sp. B-S-A6]MDI3404590.1 hypothetical protein [Streptomyces sp. B-S-A6]